MKKRKCLSNTYSSTSAVIKRNNLFQLKFIIFALSFNPYKDLEYDGYVHYKNVLLDFMFKYNFG